MPRKNTARKVQVSVPAPRTAPTREVRFDNIVDLFVEDANSTARYATTALETWNNKFMKNPAYAFSWSAEAFREAARLEVANYVRHVITTLQAQDDPYAAPSSEQIVARVTDEVRREMMQKAKYPERSTSPTSNEMSTCLMAAWADLLDRMERATERAR